MTRDDIIRMAKKVEISFGGHPMNPLDVYLSQLERFAALVAQAEREACAKLCDEFDAENPHIGQGRACAFAIRARGEKP